MTSNDLKLYVFTLASNDLRGHRGQNSILKRHHVVILGIKMTSNDLKIICLLWPLMTSEATETNTQ